MSEISDLLRGQADRYHNQCLLNFAMFSEYLDSTGQTGAIPAEHLQLFQQLGNLPGTVILQHATPFLWRQLRNCYYHASRGNAELLRSCQDFLVMAFDSFFEDLPSGATIGLEFEEPTSIALPSLGILTPPLTGKVRLERSGIDGVVIKTDRTVHSIALENVKPQFRFPGLDIDSQATLLLSYHPMLISSKLQKEIAQLRPEDPAARQIRDSIASAHALVESIDPGVSSRLRRLIKFYIALKDPERAFTHNSFTSSSLIGVIFLSSSYQVDKLAEAIVHEFYHNELNMVTESLELWTKTGFPELFYSPWRNDARPLSGLFHAIYVFWGVVRLCAEAEKRPELAREHPQFHERRQELCYQLRTALAQVTDNRLTDAGRKLINWITDDLKEHGREVGLGPALPARQIAHLRNWLEQYPDLSASVNLRWANELKSAVSSGLDAAKQTA
jgi:HEXXH motif-containing protein